MNLENLIDKLRVEDIHSRIISEQTHQQKSNGENENAQVERPLRVKEKNSCTNCRKKGTGEVPELESKSEATC